MRWTTPTHPPRLRGFTLIELLLVVALVLALTSALVFNFSNLMKGSQLEEGTTRLETLLRFARAQAANSGRKVQLVFGADLTATNRPPSTGEVRATWEPDPLGQPGCFADLDEAQWHVKELNDCVQVEGVKLLDASGANTTAVASDDEIEDEFGPATTTQPMAPITFYPDGSSDSAEIIVAAKSSEEVQDQRMAVRLVGLTGSISHQLLTPDSDEVLSESGLPDRAPAAPRDNVVRDVNLVPDSAATVPIKPTSATGSSVRALPSAPRMPVGETNAVDQAQ